MKKLLLIAALVGCALPSWQAWSKPVHKRHTHHSAAGSYVPYSTRPSDYSNGYGTNAANSAAVGPITPNGGYVVNEYGYGSYVTGPGGFGGYPAGSVAAEGLRQRQQWKCEYAPETC